MGLSPRRINSFLKKELSAKGVRWSARQVSPQPRQQREWMKIPAERIVRRFRLSRYSDLHPSAVERDFSPAVVKIRLTEHIGEKSTPCVKAGQPVAKGEVIAASPANAKLGSCYHSSISGIVEEVCTSHVQIRKK
jgi:hypothetical protein